MSAEIKFETEAAPETRWVEAAALLQRETPGTLKRLAMNVRSRCSGLNSDVESAALLQACSLLAGDTDRNLDRAAAIAVQHAKRDVARALSREVPGDIGEHVADTINDDRTRLWSRITSPSADTRYRVTLSDVARAVRDCLQDTDHGPIWHDSVKAYLQHRRSTCAQCAATGNLPTLVNMLGHGRGLTRADSEFWRLHRAAEAARALAAPRVLAILKEWSGRQSCNVWTEAALETLQGISTRPEYLQPEAAGLTLQTLIADVLQVTEQRTVTVSAVMRRGPVPEARRDAFDTRADAAEAARKEAYGFELIDRGDLIALDNPAMPAPMVWDAAKAGTVPPDARISRAPEAYGEYLQQARTTRRETVTRAVLQVTGSTAAPMPTEADLGGQVSVSRRLPDGTRTEAYQRGMTEQERAHLQALRTREAAGIGTHKINQPDPYTGQVPSGKQPTSRRKGKRGSTGPMTAAGAVQREPRRAN